MIKLDNLSFAYSDDKSEKALDSISLEIPRGEFLCIVGPSGCGKTTLLRILAGLSFPTEGTLTVDGKPTDGPRPP